MARTDQGRDVHLVKPLVLQAFGGTDRLALPPLGQRWVVDAQPGANPFGLTVADENDPHAGTVVPMLFPNPQVDSR